MTFNLKSPDAAFYRIERRLSYLQRVPSITVTGPLYPPKQKGRSKRGWTTPKGV
jgi:hypothetical protein